VAELRLRKRTRLKHKQAHAVRAEIEALVGGPLWADDAAVETAEASGELRAVLVGGVIHGLVLEGRPFLSVRGLLAYRPQARWVTVDMGAVRFVTNGADIMAPGITAADPVLAEGDWCWIRDERHRQPLAVGISLLAGAAMGPARSGKAVRSVHHIGDALWLHDAEAT
jgi:PUA domain protein